MSYHLSAPGEQTIDWSVAVAGESKNTPRGRRVSKAARRVKALPTPSPIERRMTKFLREPLEMRTAAGVSDRGGDARGGRRWRRPVPPPRPRGVPDHLDRHVVRAADGDHG